MRTISCRPVIGSNRVSLTKEVLDILQVKEGEYLQFIESDGKIILAKVEPIAREVD